MGSSMQKGIVVASLCLVCFLCIVISNGLTGKPPAISASDTGGFDIKTPMKMSEVTDEMPPMSQHSYGISEYQVLSDIVSQGGIIAQYRHIFQNRAREDYDIKGAYEDYSTDMLNYKAKLEEHIATLSSLSPATQAAQKQQELTLSKVKQLYAKVAEFDEHQKNPKDTVKYLDSCSMTLRRVNQAMTLPIQP